MNKKNEVIYSARGKNDFKSKAATLLKVRADIRKAQRSIDKRLLELIIETGYMTAIPKKFSLDTHLKEMQ